MYAVIETGGKQYRVSPGQTVEVELLDEAAGEQVKLDRVLMISADGRTLVGQPVVAGAQVVGTITREGRGKKIIVFKYKSKKRYRVKSGHRQDYTYLTITDIQAEGKSLVPDDERRRYERLARRAAVRYEQRLAGELVPAGVRADEDLEPVDALAFDEAIGDEEAIAHDEADIEAAGPDEELPADVEASEAEAASAEAGADTETAAETGTDTDTDADQPGPGGRRQRRPRRS